MPTLAIHRGLAERKKGDVSEESLNADNRTSEAVLEGFQTGDYLDSGTKG